MDSPASEEVQAPVELQSMEGQLPAENSAQGEGKQATTGRVPSTAPQKAEDLEFAKPPIWRANSNQAVPNAGWLSFSLPLFSNSKTAPEEALIEITNGDNFQTLKRLLPEFEVSPLASSEKTYSIPLFDFMPAQRYRVTVSLINDEGQTVLKSEPLEIETALLPDLFPKFEVQISQPLKMEPGLTLFNLIRWENDKPDTDFGAIVAVDSMGQVRWYYQATHLIFIVRQLSNGNLLYGYGNRTDGLIEIDLFGNVVRQWNAANLNRNVPRHSIPVAIDSLHHDVVKLNEETFLALSTELHKMKPYYDPAYHPRRKIPEANLVTDVVVEFNAAGTIVKKFPLFELLDPRRIGYGSLHHFWDSRGYESVPGGTFDWSHSNSVTYDSRDDSILVSVRHQDAVIKIDRSTGELVWILGNPREWKGRHARKLLKPVGRPKWQYHQHAVEITPQGTLLLFDNGNFRATPFDKQVSAKENRSRVVEFKVDESNMTVEQVWEYDGQEQGPFYSTFLCDVDWLPQTGNVLITNGGEIRDENDEQTDAAPGDRQWAEIFEVTYGKSPQRVFDLTIQSSEEQPEIGWSVYRGERMSDFFGSAKR